MTEYDGPAFKEDKRLEETKNRKFNNWSLNQGESLNFEPAYQSDSSKKKRRFLDAKPYFVIEDAKHEASSLENYQVPYLEKGEVEKDFPVWVEEKEEIIPKVNQIETKRTERASYKPAFTKEEKKSFKDDNLKVNYNRRSVQASYDGPTFKKEKESLGKENTLEEKEEFTTNSLLEEKEEISKEEGFTPKVLPKPYQADDIRKDYEASLANLRSLSKRLYKSREDYLLFED